MFLTKPLIGFTITLIFCIIVSWAYKQQGHIGWGIFAGCVMGGFVGVIIILFQRMEETPGES